MAQVEYSRLFSIQGKFEHEKIGLVDEVQPGETVDQAHERLKSWVEAKHVEATVERSLVQHERDRLWELRNQVATAENRAREVVGYWHRAVKRYGELRELLAKHGVEVPELDSYYLPPAPQIEPGELADGNEIVI